MGQKRANSEPKLDEEVEETFPASDPPSYMGSAAVAGSPKDGAGASNGAKHSVQHSRASVNLNTASEEELGALPALGPELVRALIDGRPFKSWEDLKDIPGFEGRTIAELKQGGAYIGWEAAGPA